MSPYFAYKARNRQGEIVQGNLVANSPGAATAMLLEKQLFVMEIKPRKLGLLVSRDIFVSKVGARDLAIFCHQFSTMNSAGIPIIQCLKILTQQTANKKMVEAIQGMIEMIEKGQSFAESAREYPKVFSQIFVSMLDAGEISGNLAKVTQRMAKHFEKEHDLQEKFKSIMTYPAMVVVVAIWAVVTLMVFVIPTLTSMVTEYNIELPFITRLVMEVSSFIYGYWYIGVNLLIAVGLVFKKYTSTSRGRAVMNRLLINLPVWGGLVKRAIISRFARTMSMLLTSGVPLLQAFDIVKKVAGNVLVENAIVEAADCVKEGQGITQPLQKSGIFPPMVTQMISIGEKTGTVDLMLEKLAEHYDREVEDIVPRLTSLMETILIIGVGIIVGFIIISVMLPMFSFVSSVN